MDCDICRWFEGNRLHPTHFDHAVWRRNMLAISFAETYVADGSVDDQLLGGYRDAARHIDDLMGMDPTP